MNLWKKPELPKLEEFKFPIIIGDIVGGYSFEKDGVRMWMYVDKDNNDVTSIPFLKIGQYKDLDGKFLFERINGFPVSKSLLKK